MQEGMLLPPPMAQGNPKMTVVNSCFFPPSFPPYRVHSAIECKVTAPDWILQALCLCSLQTGFWGAGAVAAVPHKNHLTQDSIIRGAVGNIVLWREMLIFLSIFVALRDHSDGQMRQKQMGRFYCDYLHKQKLPYEETL